MSVNVIKIVDCEGSDHLWLQFEVYGVPIFRQAFAQCVRDYMEPIHQKDIDSGDVTKGLQPETAFAKLALMKKTKREINIA